MESHRKAPFRILASLLCVVFLLSAMGPSWAAYENTHQNTGNQAADLVSVALTQMGYTDGANGVQEYSKYGDWYGIPTGYWCAMFVSWCAKQAGISTSVLPRFASCTAGMRTFQKMGCWQNGPQWGGTYTPKMGDLVFYDWYGTGAANHVGIVLYCEDGWLYSVEGNTYANRLDQIEAYKTAQGTDGPYIPDLVMVRARRLDSIYIRGYAVPHYANSGTPAAPLQGYVDIPGGTDMASDIQRVLAAELMAPMSSHTFGPMYGMTRGEYISVLANYLEMEGYDPDTVPFADLPEGHPAYDAVMAFRAAGIVNGTGGNCVQPDEYITVETANTILERIYGLFDRESPEVSYAGQAQEGYLQRYEAAHALCVLMNYSCKPAFASTPFLFDGAPVTLDTMQYGGINYVTAETWQQMLSGGSEPVDEDAVDAGLSLKAPSETPAPVPEEAEPIPEEPESTPEEPEVPSGESEPGAEEQKPLLDREVLGELTSFSWNWERWYKLRDLAASSELSVGWDSEAGLTQLTSSKAW